MQNFYELIFDLSLVDLPLMGETFTWSNSHLWSRLDHFLISFEWEAHFLDVCQKRLPRLCADHFPIMLDCGGIQKGRQYLSLRMWLKPEGFVYRVRQWWPAYQFHSTPSFVLAAKLKVPKHDLKI